MREARRLLRHVRFVHLAFVRNPAAAIFTLAFPLGLLLVLTTLLREGSVVRNGITVDRTTYHVVAMAVFGTISACYTNVAMTVTLARERGVLKRLRATPLPVATAVLARVIHASAVALVLVALTVTYGAAIGTVDPSPTSAAEIVGVVVLAAACFSALGLAVSTIVRDAAAAPPVVNGLVFPLLLLSGVFVPIGDDAPRWVDAVAAAFPIRPAFDSALGALTGSGVAGTDVLVLAGWTVVGVVVAVRRFRWEPAG
jgi:ABC-2 type transport system permease protein